jgi:AhpD family alkylhydroperoxidase
MISLAVAVTTRRDGCIASHVEAALAQGATKAEIAEALGVAIAMNAGAALVYSARAMDCVHEMSSSARKKTKEAHALANGDDSPCKT